MLPSKSKEKYSAVYEKFMEWRDKKNLATLSEEVILLYFEEQVKSLKPPTVWAIYSMLRSTLNLNNQVDIAKYPRIVALVKKHSEGYKPKKSKVLLPGNIEKFLNEADDDRYLATKVALIFGVKGACRVDELTRLLINDVENQGRLMLVHIRNSEAKIARSFVIDGDHRNIVEKYKDLRPPYASCNRFFLNYQYGKCTNQPIGKHKFASMPKQIAGYLKLPNPNSYTGHCFRRTSATLLANSGRITKSMCQLGGWKSRRRNVNQDDESSALEEEDSTMDHTSDFEMDSLSRSISTGATEDSLMYDEDDDEDGDGDADGDEITPDASSTNQNPGFTEPYVFVGEDGTRNFVNIKQEIPDEQLEHDKEESANQIEDEIKEKAQGQAEKLTLDITIPPADKNSDLGPRPSKIIRIENSKDVTASTSKDSVFEIQENGLTKLKISGSNLTLQLNNCSNVSIHLSK